MFTVAVSINSIKDFDAWSGAKFVLDSLEGNALTVAETIIEQEFNSSVIDENELNDFIWFVLPDLMEAQGYKI